MSMFGIRTLVASLLFMVTFSHIIVTLFGKDIPGVVTSFFKGAEEFVILGLLFVFILAWMRKVHPKKRSGPYVIAIFDVFGNATNIDGLRTTFSTNDVATSFVRYYKQAYPTHNFAILTDTTNERRTIVRYV